MVHFQDTSARCTAVMSAIRLPLKGKGIELAFHFHGMKGNAMWSFLEYATKREEALHFDSVDTI